jgi:hypothetical protein
MHLLTEGEVMRKGQNIHGELMEKKEGVIRIKEIIGIMTVVTMLMMRMMMEI